MKTFTAKNTTIINTGLAKHYNLWVKRKRVPMMHRVDKYELMKIAMAIFAEIGKQIVVSKGGVLIRNFGYFFVWKTQPKTTFGTRYSSNNKQEQYNHHTNHHRYMPIFMPAGGSNNLRFWSMDYKFADNVKQGIKTKLKQGFQYFTYLYSSRKLLNLN